MKCGECNIDLTEEGPGKLIGCHDCDMVFCSAECIEKHEKPMTCDRCGTEIAKLAERMGDDADYVCGYHWQACEFSSRVGCASVQADSFDDSDFAGTELYLCSSCHAHMRAAWQKAWALCQQ